MSTKDTSAVDQAAIDTARAEGLATGKAEGLKEGATAERARISAILDSEEGKKRPAAALAFALDTDLSPDQASNVLSKIAPEQAAAPVADPNAAKGADGAAKDFQAAMNNSDNPNLGAPGGEKKELSKVDQALLDAGLKPKAA